MRTARRQPPIGRPNQVLSDQTSLAFRIATESTESAENHMLHDLKHAYRMLMHSKGWTVVVLLSLAIGIGATTALFTAVNGLLLQTVPVRDPQELVILKWTGKNNMVRSSSDYGFSKPLGDGRDGSVRSTFSNAIYQQLRS